MKKAITALFLCAVVLSVNCLGGHMEFINAASFVTADDASLELEFEKETEGRLLPGKPGQRYEVVLKHSGKLTVYLTGKQENVRGFLTDADGKEWNPVGEAKEGVFIYQLKSGTYHYQVCAENDADIQQSGLAYVISAKFQSAEARYENNSIRNKAVKLPLNKIFYGHLAQNDPYEYYKITLKRMSFLEVSINTSVADMGEVPESYEVSLYDKKGRKFYSSISPDFIHMYDENAEDEYNESGWIMNGVTQVLDAGTYYIGVRVYDDKNSKTPPRYGRFKIHASMHPLAASIRLSRYKAEYTGKKITTPKVYVKEYPKALYYDDRAPYEPEDYRTIVNLRYSETAKYIKDIGRYKITDQGVSTIGYRVDGSYAYAIFTVTPVRGNIRRITSKHPGRIQVLCKKDRQSSGYEIQIARDKKFKKSRQTIDIKKTSQTIKGLSSGKKYYIRVRNYKEMETEYCFLYGVKEKIRGRWSKAKAIVCK
ncbi:MAG: hypothetical protein HFI69_12105 [Lachnospiraceae bacterium]|nr:hypothetical protein [Lachnospiraceae bacterium]